MIVYYAVGGGLGHLTRARAMLHTLGCEREAIVLSSSPFAADARVTHGMSVRLVPVSLAHDRQGYGAWLTRLFNELQPHTLFLDTFPAGIVGEFCDFPALDGLTTHYIARRLRWDVYAQQLRVTIPRFQAALCLEPLEGAHEQFICAHAASVSSFTPVDPPVELSVTEQRELEKLSEPANPFWLIVHAGSRDESAELIAYAEELRRYEGARARFVIAGAEPDCTPGLSIHHLGLFPVRALFPYAERVISACGFNVMRQMSPFRAKHSYLPFARRFDDQYWRAAYWRQG